MSSAEEQETTSAQAPLATQRRVNEQPPAQDAFNKEEQADTSGLQDGQALSSTPIPPVQVPDRYDSLRCKLTFSIIMLEDDGDLLGRQVLIGVRNDEDIPLTELVRAPTLESLLPSLIALQAKLVADLPQRQEAMHAQLEATRRKQQTAKTTPKRETKARSSARILPPGAQPDEAVDAQTTPEAPASAASPHVMVKPTTKAKHTTRNGDESPLEQMTLFR